ncbi:MAG: 2Fe-2S iron-sulfur cluster-binding protein [Arenimonas sp.]
MNALTLLGYISAALLLQLAVGIAITVRNYRRDAVHPTLTLHDNTAATPTSAWQGLREFRVLSRQFEDIAQTVCSFYLGPVDALPLANFLSGQFLTVSLHIQDLKQQTKILTRCYSLSDNPGLKHYRISIKRTLAPSNLSDVQAGIVSNYFHDYIREGDIIGIRAPAGQFTIDSASNAPIVLIAGGIGITPLLSMLLWCIEHQPTRAIHFYYGVRNSQEQAFKAQLEQLARQHENLHLHVVYSNPVEGDTLSGGHQHFGYVDMHLLRSTLPYGEQHFYVCGPAAMMEMLVPGLIEWGVSRKNIHFEAFGPASVHAYQIADDTAENLSVEVKFQKSERTLVWDGSDQNLLDFAERNHIAAESGCRAGSCGSCETKLVSGTVSYREKPEYDVAPGHCLLCVGRPDSALVIEA